MNRYLSLTPLRLKACEALHAAVNGKGYGAEVLRLRGETLQQAIDQNLAIFKSALLPAIEREAGPLYRALDAATLEPAVRRQLDREVVLLCPLLGVLAPSDHVPLYRCPIGAQIPEWGRLHAFWKPHVTKVLNRVCRGLRVFSFLPKRLRALWESDGKCLEVVEVQFFRRTKEDRLLPEHAGSARLAGELARHLLVSGTDDPKELTSFKSSFGHVWSPAETSLVEGERRLAFVR